MNLQESVWGEQTHYALWPDSDVAVTVPVNPSSKVSTCVCQVSVDVTVVGMVYVTDGSSPG